VSDISVDIFQLDTGFAYFSVREIKQNLRYE